MRFACAFARTSSSFCDEMRVACAAPPVLAACLKAAMVSKTAGAISPASSRLEQQRSSAFGKACETLAPSHMRRGGLIADVAPDRGNSLRHFERRRAPAKLFAGAFDLLGAERRAMDACRARLRRRAIADHRLAGDQARPVGRLRVGRALCRDRLGIMAVDADRIPASRLEARDLIDGIGEVDRAIDSDTIIVPEDDQLRQSCRWPASAIASWLMPSIRQPSPAMT